MKQCIRCKEVKNMESFGLDRHYASGVSNVCKGCKREANKITNKRRTEKEYREKVAQAESLRELLFKKDTEVWNYIPNTNNVYQASESGEIRTIPTVVILENGKYKVFVYKILKKTMKKGYWSSTIKYKGKMSTKGTHRYICKAFYGESELQVDHINGIKTDNRITNLRYVNSSDNVNNVKTLNPHKYASELHGITPRRGRWESYITINNKSYFLGSYESQIEAHEKYKKAKFNWEKLGNLPKKERPKQYTSKHVGIGFHKLSNKWRLRIDGIYIGLFKTESVALRVYNICYFIKQRLKVLDKELVNKIKNKYSNYE